MDVKKLTESEKVLSYFSGNLNIIMDYELCPIQILNQVINLYIIEK